MTGLIRTAIFATMLLALPAGALSSAVPHADIMTSHDYRHDDFRPGQDGIDYTIITGPTSSQSGRLPACADPARRGNLRPC